MIMSSVEWTNGNPLRCGDIRFRNEKIPSTQVNLRVAIHNFDDLIVFESPVS
jgi:hypothetical protein